jgi:hypothetical protein
MVEKTEAETIGDYFGRFSVNVPSPKNNNSQKGENMLSYFQKFSDSFIKETEDVENILDKGVIGPISEGNQDFEITPKQLVNVVNSSVEDESPLGIIQSKLHLFNDCKSWKDVRKKLGKVYKENIMAQTFALGFAMVVSPEVIPPLKYVVGPAMIKTGYENSEFLQKKVKKSLIEDYVKVDYKKGSIS